MTNFLRTLWVALVLMALLVPTLLLGMASATLADQPAQSDGPATAPVPVAAGMLRPLGTPEVAPKRTNDPILMAGSSSGVWLAVPETLERDGKPLPFFELWEHQRNASDEGHEAWRVATNNGQRFSSGMPRALAALAGISFDPVRSTERDRLKPYVIVAAGADEFVRGYTIADADEFYQRLPDLESTVAAASGRRTIFVLTRGGRVVETAPATQPETSPQSAPASSSRPAPKILPDQVWNVWAFYDDLPPEKLPPVGDIDPTDPTVPTLGAGPVLLHTPGQLILAWREASAPSKLIVRTLAYQLAKPDGPASATNATTRASAWSAPVVSDVSENIGRLFPLAFDTQAVLAWPVKNPKTPTQINLHGRSLDGQFRAQPHALFPVDHPLELGPMSENVNDAKDLALAPSGSALMVVTCSPNGKLQSHVFAAGHQSGTPVVPHPVKEDDAGRPMSHFAQNIMLIILVALLALSLWQWRLRPVRLALPKTYRVARLRERALAAAIDMAIPTILTVVVFGFYNLEEWTESFQKWDETLSSFVPLVLASNKIGWPQLFVALGGYLAHVTIGEILTGRSIGKAIVKLRVVTIDGAKAPPLLILIRNLVKIPEIATGVLLIYIVISEHRQRLGDLLARTMVIDVSSRKFEDPAAKDTGRPRSDK